MGHPWREGQSPLCDQCGSHPLRWCHKEWATRRRAALSWGGRAGTPVAPLTLVWTGGDARLSTNMMAGCEAVSRPRSVLRDVFRVSRR